MSADHYFSAAPKSEVVTHNVTLKLPGGHTMKLETASGTFSAEQIDRGTQVLLDKSPLPTPGSRVLDLGCGYGPIACGIAAQMPAASVWAIDINQRALDLTAKNARKLKLTNVTVGDSGEPFDFIYSNPPIRVGKTELHDLLTTWLARLAPNGIAYLVVHKHLGSDSLQKWLQEQGHKCDRISSQHGYRVLAVA